MMSNMKTYKIITDTTKKSEKESKTIKLEVPLNKNAYNTTGILAILNLALNLSI